MTLNIDKSSGDRQGDIQIALYQRFISLFQNTVQHLMSHTLAVHTTNAMRSVRSYKGQFNLANGDQFRTILLEI